jgi:hypothetical protein
VFFRAPFHLSRAQQFENWPSRQRAEAGNTLRLKEDRPTATPTNIPDVFVIEPKVFGDVRGFFESFNQKVFNDVDWIWSVSVQDNHSRSSGHVQAVYQLQQTACAWCGRCS